MTNTCFRLAFLNKIDGAAEYTADDDRFLREQIQHVINSERRLHEYQNINISPKIATKEGQIFSRFARITANAPMK